MRRKLTITVQSNCRRRDGVEHRVDLERKKILLHVATKEYFRHKWSSQIFQYVVVLARQAGQASFGVQQHQTQARHSPGYCGIQRGSHYTTPW
jgi:hypothetical protein